MTSKLQRELISSITEVLRSYRRSLTFPVIFDIEEELDDGIQIEFDCCAECHAVSERNGDWYNTLCPECAHTSDRDEDYDAEESEDDECEDPPERNTIIQDWRYDEII